MNVRIFFDFLLLKFFNMKFVLEMQIVLDTENVSNQGFAIAMITLKEPNAILVVQMHTTTHFALVSQNHMFLFSYLLSLSLYPLWQV